MPMTHVPQRTAISQACGAFASALIGTAGYYQRKPHGFTMGALALEMLLGFLTSWPINRWLLRRGIKEPMPTA